MTQSDAKTRSHVAANARGSLRLKFKATSGQTRSHNRALVLQTLYRTGPLSRADLARTTSLTKVTVSDLVMGLMDDGLVIELGLAEASGPGKPAVLLDVARHSHLALSLDLSDHDHWRGAILDLDGTVLHRATVPLDGATGAAAVDKAAGLATGMLDHAQGQVLGLGVGTPGVVDLDGVVRTAPNLGWQDEPLRAELASATGLEVTVSNDANAAVIAEHDYGGASSDLLLINVGRGLGSALIVGGRPVVGSTFAAGEIGQTVVGTDVRDDVPYSRENMLEHWLSVPGLQSGLAAVDPTDPTARESVLREAGTRLGVALAPIVGLLNLAEIVLAGPEDLLAGPLADATLQTLKRRTMPESHAGLVVRMSSQGEDIVLRGAASQVVRERLGLF